MYSLLVDKACSLKVERSRAWPVFTTKEVEAIHASVAYHECSECSRANVHVHTKLINKHTELVNVAFVVKYLL